MSLWDNVQDWVNNSWGRKTDQLDAAEKLLKKKEEEKKTPTPSSLAGVGFGVNPGAPYNYPPVPINPQNPFNYEPVTVAGQPNVQAEAPRSFFDVPQSGYADVGGTPGTPPPNGETTPETYYDQFTAEGGGGRTGGETELDYTTSKDWDVIDRETRVREADAATRAAAQTAQDNYWTELARIQQAQLEALNELNEAKQKLAQRQFEWEQDQSGVLSPYQKGTLLQARNQLEQEYGIRQQELEQNQQRLDQEQKNYEAQLRANPINWLQYEDVTGGTPVIQPWMKPLMPQQYGLGQAGSTNIPAVQATPTQTAGVGQPIPGWGNAAEMPKLATPATQYTARMGPTAHGQYQGYQQYTTAASPEETNFRLWNRTPPSGKNSGLTYMR